MMNMLGKVYTFYIMHIAPLSNKIKSIIQGFLGEKMIFSKTLFDLELVVNPHH